MDAKLKLGSALTVVLVIGSIPRVVTSSA